jgi:hypothetical protein
MKLVLGFEEWVWYLLQVVFGAVGLVVSHYVVIKEKPMVPFYIHTAWWFLLGITLGSLGVLIWLVVG